MSKTLSEMMNDAAPRWRQAAELAATVGVKPSDPAYGDVLALALEEIDSQRNDLESYVQGRAAGLHEARCQAEADSESERADCAAAICAGCLDDDSPTYDGATDNWYHGRRTCLATPIWNRRRRERQVESAQKTATGTMMQARLEGLCHCGKPLQHMTDCAVTSFPPSLLNTYAGNCGKVRRNDIEQTVLNPLEIDPSLLVKPGVWREGVSMSKEDAREMYPSLGVDIQGAMTSPATVTFAGYRYGFDERGAYRTKSVLKEGVLPLDSVSFDRAFALPVAEAMKERGFTAGNVTILSRIERRRMVVDYLDALNDVTFSFSMGIDDVWHEKWQDKESGEWRTRTFKSVERRFTLPQMPKPRRMRGVPVDPNKRFTEPVYENGVDERHTAVRLEQAVAEKMYPKATLQDLYLPKAAMFDDNGIPWKAGQCSRCDGELSNGRVSVCETCEPDAV